MENLLLIFGRELTCLHRGEAIKERVRPFVAKGLLRRTSHAIVSAILVDKDAVRLGSTAWSIGHLGSSRRLSLFSHCCVDDGGYVVRFDNECI